MKAMVINRYGPPEVLEYATLERPVPKEDELLVKVCATSVNPVECAMRRGELKLLVRLKFPAVLGVDVSGEVVEMGQAVSDFRVGDAVHAFIALARSGGYAEYAVVRAAWAGRKPANLSYVEAAVVPGVGLTALQALRDRARLQTGQRVLINGGAGGVGTFAIQIARALGARVTAVCSAPKVDLVRRLGAERVIDYTREDFTKDRDYYDVILDCVGNRTFWTYRKMLRTGGIHVAITPTPKQFLFSKLSMLTPGKASQVFLVQPDGKDLEFLRGLIEAGQVQPVIDRTYALPQIAEAHRYIETKRATGKVAVTVTA